MKKKELKQLEHKLKNATKDTIESIIQSLPDNIRIYFKKEKVNVIRQSKLLDNFLFIETEKNKFHIKPEELRYLKLRFRK